MAAINQYHNWLKMYLVGLTLSASVCLGSVKFIDLRNPNETLPSQPAIPQGGVLALEVSPDTQVWFNEKPVFVSAAGLAIIALHRDDTQAQLKLVSVGGVETSRALDVTMREYRIERIDGLPPAKVTAPMDPKIRERIRNEAAEIRAARKKLDDRQDFLNGFIWPVEGRISGVYGSQRVLNGEPKTPHYGVDVAVPTGTSVVAPADGKVIYANTDMYYSGGTLVIDHGHGLSSTFLHLSKIEVTVGQVVKQGEIVARVGSTGRSTGPHLDWRMNLGSSTRIDPQLLVQPMQKQTK